MTDDLSRRLVELERELADVRAQLEEMSEPEPVSSRRNLFRVLINFVGNKIGITGVAGSKFITLTWTTTIMLLVNMSFWALAFFLIGRVAKKSGGEGRKSPDRTSMVAMGEYEVSRPLPVHTDRNGHAMI